MSSLYNQENKNLQELLHHAIVERAKSDQPQADALLKEKSRLTADCYDIHCLSRFAGFNESYLTSSANDWNQTNIKEEWNFLMQMLNLPLN